MHTFTPAALFAIGAALLAHAAPVIPPPPSIPITGTAADNSANIQTWLIDSDAQWAATLSQEALAPTAAEIEKLIQRYLASVEARIAEARQAGNLETVLLWQKEKDAVALSKQIPSEDHPTDPSALKQLRAAARAEMMKLARTRADQTKAVLARYEAALRQAQVALTQRGRFDDALLLKARRDELAAYGLPGSKEALAAAPPPPPPPPVTARLAPAPSTPAPVVPVGESGRLAEVQVERAKMLPLMMGEKVWSNRDQAIGRVPARFKGYRFTQFSVHSKTIKFKVKSNGLVNLCVPAHWWKPPAEQFPGPDHRTEAQLVGEGWIRHAGDEFFVGEDKWWVFSRQCQAGEQFSISTDRLESPILIFK